MAPRRPFTLVYDPAVRDQLAAIEPRHHPVIRRAIEEQLVHHPEVETRNRKPLQRPSALGTAWELRCGPQNRFRVFYAPDPAKGQVRILAIGEKTGSRLKIAGEEFDL